MAGDGMSVRMGRYFGESLLVGLLTGFVVVGFRYMIAFGKTWIMEGLGHHRFLSRLSDGSAFGESETLRLATVRQPVENFFRG